ncbi:hypothetical protein HDU81_008812 [Chytriomyces hyalinus]|nr:hypothetical protein HDU81_008812 [Chytriomyces hyalinus]
MIYQTESINSVAYQGAGLLNAYYAASAQSLVTPSAIALKDTDNFMSTVVLTIRNNGEDAVTYNLRSFSAATVNAYNTGDDFTLDATTTTFTNDQQASVSFSVSSIKVASGSSAQVTVKFTAPEALTPYPIYSGYLEIVASNQEDYPIHVPYAGVVGSYKNKAIWSRKSPSLAARWGKDYGLTEANVATGLYADLDFNPLTEGAAINATAGAGVMAVASSTSRGGFIEVLAQGNSKRSNDLEAAGFNTSAPIYIRLTDAVTEGNPSSPAVFTPMQRHSYAGAAPAPPPTIWAFTGIAYDANGNPAALPAGNYKMKFSAVRNFASASSTNDADYDIILSPTFRLITDAAPVTSSSAATAASTATSATVATSATIATSSAGNSTAAPTGVTVASSDVPSASGSAAASTSVPVVVVSSSYVAPGPATPSAKPSPTNLYKAGAVSAFGSVVAALVGAAMMF